MQDFFQRSNETCAQRGSSNPKGLKSLHFQRRIVRQRYRRDIRTFARMMEEVGRAKTKRNLS